MSKYSFASPVRSWKRYALTALALSFMAHPAIAAETRASAPIYTWKTESAKDEKTGAMKHCLVKNAFDNGTLLILAENNDGLQRLAIHFPQDTLEQGVLVDLTLQVDKQDVFPVEGMTSTPRILAMNVPEALADQLRKGSVLRVRGPEDEIAYELQGTDKAVRELRDCVASHKNPAMVRTKLAAISDADSDIHSPPPARAILPAEMMDTPPAPISADAIKDNLGLDNEQMAALGNDKTPAAKAAAAKTVAPKPATVKPDAVKGATAMPVVPVPVIKADNIPNAAKTSGNKTAEGLLPMKWQHIFSNLAVGPKAMTVNGTKLNMTAPLQHAWTINDFKIGLNLGQPLNTDGLDQSAKHYMFNMRRACQGEFVAEADEQKVTTNGMIRWQIAETVCAGKKGEVLTALLFTTSSDESVIIAIEGKMQDAPRLIRLRNDVLQMMSR